ncbi:MAG: hypothetical protein ACFFAS_12750 [Promethearchaeota archaeon]
MLKQRLRTILLMSLFVFLFIAPPVRGNPVGISYFYFIHLGYIFIFFVIIPSTLVFTFLIECGVYLACLSRKVDKKRKLASITLFINFLTVPITQWIAFQNALYILDDLWIYIAIEGIIITVEYFLFKREVKKYAREIPSKKIILLVVFIANLVSFLIGLPFFYAMNVFVFDPERIYISFLSFIGIIQLFFIVFFIVLLCFLFATKKSKANSANKDDKYQGLVRICYCICFFLVFLFLSLVFF